MKKMMTVILMMILLLCVQGVSAYDGTCGTNVAYTINQDTHTISFTKAVSGQDAVWGSDCRTPANQESIKIIRVDDPIKVTDARYMFYDFRYAEEMYLSNLDVSDVTDMYAMFYYCSSLTALDVSGWDTSNVTDMGWMFSDCSYLTELDVSGWDTSNVTNMRIMFYYCISLTELDVSGWDTSNVTDMDDMFYSCRSLTALDVSGWDTSKVTDMSQIFYYCISLTELDVSGWDTSNVTDMYGMFMDCSNLTALDVSGWDTSNVTYMEYMFCRCSSLTELDVSGWDTSNVTYMSGMFNRCSSLTALDVSGWDTTNVTYMGMMFQGCSSLTELNLSDWDTSNVTRMGQMFMDCISLTALDVSGWDTSNVTNMDWMFYSCSSLTELDVSRWDTSNVTDMYRMFSGCSSLQTLTLGKNSLGKNIFTTLPNYNNTWQYIWQGPETRAPLPINTALTGRYLFSSYNYITMAGTWTTDAVSSNLFLKLYISDRLNTSEGWFCDETTVLEYNDGNLIPSSIYSSNEMILEITAAGAAKNALHETITLPYGLSFSDKNYERTKSIIIGGRGRQTERISLTVYSVYDIQNKNKTRVTIQAAGNENASLDIAVKKGEGKIKFNFNFSERKNPYKEDISSIGLNWTDFPKGEYAYDEALIALGLSGAAHYSKGAEDNVSNNAMESLHNLGFTKIIHYPSLIPGTDQRHINKCAHYIAQKKVPVNGEIKTVIAVVIMGTHGQPLEWIGNIAGNIAGVESPFNFKAAAEDIYNNLLSYVSNNKILVTDAIPFVCGHSRGAAAAGIVARYINLASLWYKSVTYTFATPNNIRDSLLQDLIQLDEDNTNIYNYMYAHDIVPYVPQGFIKLGNSYVVGGSETPEKVAQLYHEYTNTDKSDRNNVMPDNSILIDLIIRLNQDLFNLTNPDLIGKDGQNEDEIAKKNNIFKRILNYFYEERFGYPHSFENYLAWLKGNDECNDQGICNAFEYMDNWNFVQNGSDKILNNLFRAVLNPEQVITNFLYNKMISKLFKNVSLSDFNDLMGVIYTIISCPVDVKLYDPDGNIVVSIVDHQMEFEIESDDYFAFTDGENDYVFYPENSGYYLKITGNDDGEMEIETLGIGKDFEIKDSKLFTDVSVSNNEQFSLNIVDEDLDQSTLISDGIIDPGAEKHVIITDNDLLTKTIDLGTTGTSWEYLTYQLGAVVRPAGSIQNVSWTSSDSTVASVDNSGLVTGLKTGTVTITATAQDESGASASVTLNIVTNIQPENILIKGLTSVGVGKSISLEAVIDQEMKPENQNLVWASEDPEIAQVSNSGRVTGVKRGTTTLKVCSAENDQYCAATEINVLNATSKVNILNGDAIKITGMNINTHDEIYQLKAQPVPLSASHIFLWSSSDPDIAEVDEVGSVSFKTSGTVTITAASSDGSGLSGVVELTYIQAAEEVRVLNTAAGDVTGQTIITDSMEYQLTAAALPAGAEQDFIWTSDDAEAASVDENGRVSFSGNGAVTITATAADGTDIFGQVNLIFYEPVNSLTLPSGLKEIGASAFEGSAAFDEVILPDGLLTIGSRAFADCGGLFRVYIPDSVTGIAEDAFPENAGLFFSCQSVNNTGVRFALEHNIPCRIEQ